MTVQELINWLEKLEDKSLRITMVDYEYYGDRNDIDSLAIEEHNDETIVVLG